MSDPRQRLTYEQVQDEELADWRFLFDKLHARFASGSFEQGLALVNRIGAAAEAADHHPDVTLTYPQVDVALSSHDVGGVTSRDVDLAREISGFAAELGIGASPEQVAVLEIALDVPAADDVRAFWATVLGYDAKQPQEVVDPGGANPALWFQTAPGATGEVAQQRFHLDLRIPRELAEARVEAAVAAGGTLVSDAHAPAFWVLADAHGNQVCICTAAGRSRD